MARILTLACIFSVVYTFSTPPNFLLDEGKVDFCCKLGKIDAVVVGGQSANCPFVQDVPGSFCTSAYVAGNCTQKYRTGVFGHQLLDGCTATSAAWKFACVVDPGAVAAPGNPQGTASFPPMVPCSNEYNTIGCIAVPVNWLDFSYWEYACYIDNPVSTPCTGNVQYAVTEC